jgi:hypothetical protein
MSIELFCLMDKFKIRRIRRKKNTEQIPVGIRQSLICKRNDDKLHIIVLGTNVTATIWPFLKKKINFYLTKKSGNRPFGLQVGAFSRNSCSPAMRLF